ncbi:hypothetical protein RFI_25674 [Reticulomyxa filosa]|uniref:Transmembrane protein n=1 Tax=Reticulomyxa filosa TaxID=46433 RepID=X6ME42_RETFI|nr:hypothetical protein RFI_25674 [Reticulomyxa filosa]|eukprot:ETO11702.1 hypothetical protein RFI_25674 [Reticulomyxa filosa]
MQLLQEKIDCVRNARKKKHSRFHLMKSCLHISTALLVCVRILLMHLLILTKKVKKDIKIIVYVSFLQKSIQIIEFDVICFPKKKVTLWRLWKSFDFQKLKLLDRKKIKSIFAITFSYNRIFSTEFHQWYPLWLYIVSDHLRGLSFFYAKIFLIFLHSSTFSYTILYLIILLSQFFFILKITSLAAFKKIFVFFLNFILKGIFKKKFISHHPDVKMNVFTSVQSLNELHASLFQSQCVI